MQRKLTITVDEAVYLALYDIVGRGKISRFIEDLIRPYVMYQELESGYRQMAQDEERESEALIWSEATIGDVDYETW